MRTPYGLGKSLYKWWDGKFRESGINRQSGGEEMAVESPNFDVRGSEEGSNIMLRYRGIDHILGFFEREGSVFYVHTPLLREEFTGFVGKTINQEITRIRENETMAFRDFSKCFRTPETRFDMVFFNGDSYEGVIVEAATKDKCRVTRLFDVGSKFILWPVNEVALRAKDGLIT